MKETVLNALLQLFAIIANVSADGVSFKARYIVKAFLRHHLKTNLINKYLVLFDQYLEMHHPYLFSGGITQSRNTISDTEKMQQIAEEINSSLLQREKFIVFLRLVEFINEDDVMTVKELSFIRTVADSFNISKTEHDNTKNFVLNACNNIEKDKILVIDKKKTPFVSGIRHLREKKLEGRIAILYHESTNTIVFRYLGNMNLSLNSQNIIPEKIELLESGSLIRGASIRPVYYSDISREFHHVEQTTKIYFVAKNIEYRFKNSSKGIRKFSFSKDSGNLIGIMGGSGTGKSTLLNILSGKLRPQSGQITINGFDIHKKQPEIEGIIGFVPQDDLLLEDLTVFRNLYLNAKLCLSNYSDTEILRKINQILSDLDLEDIRHLKVGNPLKKLISGGQRKRLNIALELIREPAVLFVDEPTSGLSSMGSEKVMLLLKEQALKGRLVVVNIHQPYSDIYKLLDMLLILDKEGHIIYKGNPIDAITYFKGLSNYANADVGHCTSCGNVMPEEILKMVEAREVDEYGKITSERRVSPEEWYGLYQERIESKQKIKQVKAALPEIEFKIPDPLAQFGIFSFRNILSKLANRQSMLITFLEAPLLAFMVAWFMRYTNELKSASSYVFRENVNLTAYMFIAVIIALFIGLSMSASEIIKDRKILERESFLRLSRLSYLHSKILVLFFISAIQTFMFVLVGNTILEIRGMFFHYWVVLFTVSCLANMIGLNISSGMNSIANAYIVIPFIIVPQLLFSGMFPRFDHLNSLFDDPAYVPLIGEMMPSRWAFEALAVHQGKSNLFTREFFEVDRSRFNASYEIDLLSTLQLNLDEANFKLAGGSDLQESATDLELVRNELQKLITSGVSTSFGNIGDIYPGRFNEDVYRTARDSLDSIKDYYSLLKRNADKKKNALSKRLIDDWGGEEAFKTMKRNYTNKHLEAQLYNRGQIVVVWKNSLVRKSMPIYQEPKSKFGRAQFFAPEKRLGNLTIETFWFNLVVIWISLCVLYATLVFDLPRKFADWNQIRMLRKRR